jgi:hypothetical protein
MQSDIKHITPPHHCLQYPKRNQKLTTRNKKQGSRPSQRIWHPYWLILLFPLYCTPSLAITLTQFHNQLSLGIGIMHQNYVEPDTENKTNKDYLDKEFGSILAITLNGSIYQKPYYLSLNSDLYAGQVTYDGHLQETYTPIISSTEYQLNLLALQAGLTLPLTRNADLILGLEGKYEQWQRNLGFIETYQHLAINALIQTNMRITKQWWCSAEAAFGKLQKAIIDVPMVNLNGESLGHNAYLRYGLTLYYRDNEQVLWLLNFKQESFSYSASDAIITTLRARQGDRLYQVWEPASSTKRFMILAGVRLLS